MEDNCGFFSKPVPCLANSVQQRSHTDSTTNQTTLKPRPGRDYRLSTGQEMLEGTSITDQESCRGVTDGEIRRHVPISGSGSGFYSYGVILSIRGWENKLKTHLI